MTDLPFEVKSEDEPNLMTWDEAMEKFRDDPHGWRLPTKDEINLMSAHREGIGGIASGYYWSSSEYGSRNAWAQYFTLGYQNYYNYKYYYLRVRAVRDKQPQPTKLLRVYDIKTSATLAYDCSVLASSISEAERIYSAACPDVTIQGITLHAEYVIVGGKHE